MRLAVLREPSNLLTQLALSGYAWEHASLSIGFTPRLRLSGLLSANECLSFRAKLL